MKLTGQEARDVVWEESEDFEKVEGTEEIYEQTRWAVAVYAVFKHLPTGKFYSFNWRKPATESQEETPFENENEVDAPEVHQVQKLVTVWENV